MSVYYQDATVTVYHGDCIEIMRGMADNSVDAVVTDPPAAIRFMNRGWDGDRGGREQWVSWLADVMREALRVTKPGGHAFVWALPRTSHWTATAIEDAGWEIRDRVVHLFGSGFPKSLDVSKAIDKANGEYDRDLTVFGAYAPATDAARQWDGWGTAMKPAAEDWWLARKPLTGTVAQNVTTWGTGVLNIAATRIGTPNVENAGRWPSNVILDEAAAARLDQQSGETTSRVGEPTARNGGSATNFAMSLGGTTGYEDTGGASRFFKVVEPDRFWYTAKASSSERVRVPKDGAGEGRVTGLGGKIRQCNECGSRAINSGATELTCGHHDHSWVDNPRPEHVSHPTVKPLSLLRHLVKLVTPPNGLILDPFAGSGTTGEAAILEGFRAVLIEQDETYLPLIEARVTRQRDPIRHLQITGGDLGLFEQAWYPPTLKPGEDRP